MTDKKPVKIRYRLIYRFSQFLIRAAMRLAFGARYIYEEPIPGAGPLIIASNHISYFDPPAVGSGVPREVHFMAKRELFANFFFGGMIRFFNAVPIRRGVMDWTAIATLKSLLGEGGAVILFPEGTRGREGSLGPPKFGVGMLAQETRASIVPAFARGTGRLKEALLRRRPMRIYYGRPIRPEEYQGLDLSTRGQLQIAELVMERIAGLKQLCEAEEGE